MEKPINLYEESLELSGARKMLLRMRDCYKIKFKRKCDQDDAVYEQAELDMTASSPDNIRHFLCGDYRVCYRNHKHDSKGRLISAEAYFAACM